MGDSKLFEKYSRLDKQRKQRENYKRFLDAVRGSSTICNKPIVLLVGIVKSENCNYGRPFINCHMWRFDRAMPYNEKLIYCCDKCKIEQDYNGEFLGAIGWQTVTDEWVDVRVDSVQNWNELTVQSLHYTENTTLFSLRLLRDRTIEIANISDKLNIKNVLVRSDIVADRVVYKGKSYSLKMDYDRMLEL